MAWLAVIGAAIGAHYVFWPDADLHWTATGIALAVAAVVAYTFAQYASEEIQKLRSRSEIMERRIDQLESALDRTSARVSERFNDDDDTLDY